MQTFVQPIHEITYFSLVIVILLLSISSALHFKFLPVTLNRKDTVVVRYFMFYFVSTAVLYPLVVIAAIVDQLSYLNVVGQCIYLVSFYFLWQGLNIRFTGNVSALKNNKWIVCHLIAFFLLMTITYLMSNQSDVYQVILLIMNCLFVCYMTQKNVYLNHKKPRRAERVVKGVIWCIIIFLIFGLVFLSIYQNVDLYLRVVLHLEIFCAFIAVLSLSSLIMSDYINTHYSNSITDEMTGLYNRRYFMEETNLLLSQSPEKPNVNALITCDIDYFKKINDQHGHAIGDKAIIALSNLLKKMSPKNAIPARLGGEEFAVFIPNMPLEFSEKLSENIRQKIHHIQVKNNIGQIVTYTASFGVSVTNENQDIEWLLRCSDEAMYYAKKVGRNRVVFYEDIID